MNLLLSSKRITKRPSYSGHFVASAGHLLLRFSLEWLRHFTPKLHYTANAPWLRVRVKMRLQVYLLTITLVVLSLNAFACRFVEPTSEFYEENSSEIYVGRIIAIELPEEFQYEDTENPMQEVIYTSQPEKIITLKVFSTIKGKNKTRLTALVKPCGGGIFKLAEKVVLFNLSGVWHVRNPEVLQKSP